MAVAVRLKLAPALIAGVPVLSVCVAFVEVTVKLDGRRLKLSVEQAEIPLWVTRMRALRAARAGAVMVTLIRPATQAGAPTFVFTEPVTGAHPDQQFVAELNTPGLVLVSSTSMVRAAPEGAAFTPLLSTA